MVCENCGEREAVIHLTQIVDNTKTQINLCEICAAEKGVETEAAVAKHPLGDFLASLGKGGGGESEPPEAGVDVPCRACGATLRDFRQTGRLGCAVCYESFESHLRDLLRRLHGSARHEGEAYHGKERISAPSGVAAPVRESSLDDLKDALKRAVESENFELAAELRDRIRVLE